MNEVEKNDVAIILLAAGSSSRMGKSKQLISINGESLLEKSIKTALQCKSKHIIVVLGANAAEHRIVTNKFPVSILNNLNWEKGIGSSIKAGLTFLQSATAPQAVIVMVCDQPLLTASHLDHLIDRFNTTRKPIIASSYSGSVGVPALFDKTMFAKLNELDDRHGAKKIIESEKEFVDTVSFQDGSVDLDTPEDVKRFLQG